MLDKKRVLVITTSFPGKNNPSEGVFVANLLRHFLTKYDLNILVPRKLLCLKTWKTNYEEFDEFENLVRRPRYINLGLRTKQFAIISLISFAISSLTFSKRNNTFIYAHFIFPNGCAAYLISKLLGIPYFIASGESAIRDLPFIKSALQNASGIITVSEKLKRQISDKYEVRAEKILVAPNRADSDRFKVLDKARCRKLLGYSDSDKILIFVGQFIERKGYLILQEAMELLDESVKVILIGRGECSVKSTRVLYKGQVNNADLPVYLNASDIFVLPTSAEGSSNAIEEAIACGLPIVSTSIEEVRAQVSIESSILIGTQNVTELYNAIIKIFENYSDYKKAAETYSNGGGIKERSKIIYSFINRILKV